MKKGTPEMKYAKAAPIRTKTCTPWQVEFEDGDSYLFLIHPEMAVEELVQLVKGRYPDKKFTVSTFWAGEFKIDKIISAYSHDGRGVNQDLEMVI